MSYLRFFAPVLALLPLLGAIPRHVQTADYWHGYAGTMTVPASQAAQSLSWVETGLEGQQLIQGLGVKTIAYSNPNRVQPGDPLYTADETTYARTCSGQRARGEAAYKGLVLTNPNSPALAKAWRNSIKRRGETAFSAIFVDEAVGARGALDQPCGYSFDKWLSAENGLFRVVGAPFIYNGLNAFEARGVSKTIALNQTAIGGMMEECYAMVNGDHRLGGWRWIATEQTEIRMARDRKYFFCYGRDFTPADQAYDSRMWTYASFLLTYDPSTTVLWEYYKTPSGGHVMPESQVVAWNPVKQNVGNIEQLRSPEGVYIRSYGQCYIAGKPQGACVAAVNPDNVAHALNLPGYKRTLQLRGSGVFDGGSVNVANAPPPSSLGPRMGIIAFK